jgi:hypothetical protein
LVPQLRLLAARRARALHDIRPSLKAEGAGNAECFAHPQPCVRRIKAHKSSHHRFAETTPAFPARMVLTVSFVVSPETGLYCLRHPREALACWGFDTSVGVSGRYDFAVRDTRLRLMRDPRPPHPAPNVRDDREAPLLSSAGWREDEGDLRSRSILRAAAN